eukprot:TRINITY_DN16656_c0_g2_i1.p1 TRINITY_DN16656_c0_g2~~TRINITY_DN16656_c0_g2_i1.p1  ORF type:complete len:547 (+),score=80.09 TRINITY_DN16656_c0_g2_i1:215-1855(+)
MPADALAPAFGMLLQKLKDAIVAAGFEALLKRRRGRMTMILIAARCLTTFGMGVLGIASINLMYELVDPRKQPGGASPTNSLKNAVDRSHVVEKGKDMVEGDVVTKLTPASTCAVVEEQAANDQSEDDIRGAGASLKSSTSERTIHHRAVQRIQTRIDTVVTLVSFVTGPLIGSFMDAYGRLPVMILGTGVPGLLRLGLTVAPSLKLYFVYRVLVAFVQAGFAQGVQVSMGDMYGRGTRSAALASSIVGRYELFASMLGMFAGRICTTRQGFLVAGVSQVSSGLLLSAAMSETLPVFGKMRWSLNSISPLSFLASFRKSRALLALALLKTVRELPNYLNIHSVYRRQKFKQWGQAQDSNMQLLMMASMFLATFFSTRVMDTLGLQATTRLHHLVGILHLANSALAPRMEFLYLNPFLVSLFFFGGDATERCLQQEASVAGVGQGELAGAQANLAFFPSLVMPNVYTAIYERCAESWPAAPYVVAASIHLLTAEALVPWAYAHLSDSVALNVLPGSQLVHAEGTLPRSIGIRATGAGTLESSDSALD